MTESAIRRRSDGLYFLRLVQGRGKFTPKAEKFFESIGIARTIVRVDLGEDTDLFEFLTRGQVAAAGELP